MSRVWNTLKSESLAVGVVLIYSVTFLIAPERAGRAFLVGAKVFIGVLPIVVAVFAALGLFNVWVDKKTIAMRLGEDSGFRVLVLASLLGTVLVGPVYVIFPLLKAVRDHGARWAVLGAVLTAWAVKIPMVPLEIGFLGLTFSVSRSILVMVAALPLGLLIEAGMRPRGDDLDLTR